MLNDSNPAGERCCATQAVRAEVEDGGVLDGLDSHFGRIGGRDANRAILLIGNLNPISAAECCCK